MTTGILWEKPYFYYEGKIFTPSIYEVKNPLETIPEGCNTVSIHLDGTVSSNLDWERAKELAQNYIKEGYFIFWNLDLGLFDKLKLPLSNQTQFLSLVLSLEHLRDTLWKEFKEKTLGVCIYNGTFNFLSNWDDHLKNNYLTWGAKNVGENFEPDLLYWKNLFARDAVAEYLQLLGNRMPDALQIFATLNVDPTLNLLMEAQLSHRERFDRLHLMIKNGKLPLNNHSAEIAVCLPGYQVIDPKFYHGFEETLKKLLNLLPFRIIPESYLINEWDGLDYLVVMPASLASQGKRKLQGFCAAGGTVVSVGNPIGLPQEIALDEFLEKRIYTRENIK